MSDPVVERFRALVERHYRFLEDRGFRRVPEDEHDSPVAASVVYAGQHVGFVIALDLRDVQVDVRVVRARGGRIVEMGPEGYSRDLLAHLMARDGYRGGAGGGAGSGDDPLDRMVERGARMLEEAGGSLLQDSPDALPGG